MPTSEQRQNSNAFPAFGAACGSAACPITYRDLHEEAAGMSLCDEFFQVSNINPDAPVKCNCKWDGGHESTCDIVAANVLLAKRQNAPDHRRPVMALGYQAPDGTIVVTDVLCMNFPDMTNEEMAALSWKLSQWSTQVRQRRTPNDKLTDAGPETP